MNVDYKLRRVNLLNLELSTEEKDKLVQIVNQYLSDLRMEIADTDSSFFKEELKLEKTMLRGLLKRLEEN